MKVEISVSEVVQVFKEIQEQPEKILEMVRADMPKVVGGYLSEIMRLELTKYLGRQPYERAKEETNHRNGSYPRNFTLNPNLPLIAKIEAKNGARIGLWSLHLLCPSPFCPERIYR